VPFLREVHEKGASSAHPDIGKGHKIQVEFVSSNPTGPLHVGHGRGAAVGDSVGNILRFCGYDGSEGILYQRFGPPDPDPGNVGVFALPGNPGCVVPFPEECYQGDYIRDIALEIEKEHGRSLLEMDETRPSASVRGTRPISSSAASGRTCPRLGFSLTSGSANKACMIQAKWTG
jgi:arginyl-tRNA synthetase